MYLPGIAPWGCVNNKECLVHPRGGWPAEYRTDLNPASRRQAPLDHNHSHFILVDNGSQYQYTVEIMLRAKLESRVARLKTDLHDEGRRNTLCLLLPFTCLASSLNEFFVMFIYPCIVVIQ